MTLKGCDAGVKIMRHIKSPNYGVNVYNLQINGVTGVCRKEALVHVTVSQWLVL